MRAFFTVACVICLAACETGSGTVTLPDADPNAPVCPGNVYDNCADNADCGSGICQLYESDRIRVCTQACGDGNPCPADAAGNAAKCNNKGLCKPTVANACRPD